MEKNIKPTFIDLFSGCGGFTLGMSRAGFRCLAAIDFNPEAIKTLKSNLSDTRHPNFEPVTHALERDLIEFTPNALSELIGTKHIDVIVGGPPCQGFSTARQRDGANHGKRLIEDPRRQLYQRFLAFIEFFQPKVFVMENVLGIRSAEGGKYYARVQNESRKLGAIGYRVHAQIEKAWELGVPQKRQRQLFIGTRLDLPQYFRPDLVSSCLKKRTTVLWDAIGDLPVLDSGSGEESCDYDLKLRNTHLTKRPSAKQYLYNVLEVNKATKITAHRARPHSKRDLGDFYKLKEGESSALAMRRGEKFDFPYDKGSFVDRYTRQHRERLCSTIVAHLSKDGLMFIHPTQNRSLTPREAARIQSFPDWFEFPIARTHQFRLIGNAVPPLVAEAVGCAVKSYLEKDMKKSKSLKTISIPKNETQAVECILPLLDRSARELSKISNDEFKCVWSAISFIYMGLHPDGACEPRQRTVDHYDDYNSIVKIEPRLLAPYYEESGWPVILVPIAKEAWHRYHNGLLDNKEFYCVESLKAGYYYRNQTLNNDLQ